MAAGAGATTPDRAGSAPGPRLSGRAVSEPQVEEVRVLGAARPAGRQVPLGMGEPVADRQQVLVVGAAGLAGRRCRLIAVRSSLSSPPMRYAPRSPRGPAQPWLIRALLGRRPAGTPWPGPGLTGCHRISKSPRH